MSTGKSTLIKNASQLRWLMVAVAAGKRPIAELDEAAARLGEWVDESDQALFSLWGGLELRLAEWTSGDIDERELRIEIWKLIDSDLAPDIKPA